MDLNFDPTSKAILQRLIDGLPASLKVAKTLVKRGGNPVLLGVDVAGFHLLIPNSDVQDSDLKQFQNKRLKVTLRDIALVGIEPGQYLCLSADPNFDLNLFGAICDEIYLQISEPAACLPNIIAVVERWAKLLKAENETVNKPEIIGLMGELLVLNELLEVGGSSKIKCWTGPQKSRHDFEFAKRSVEVKSSTSLTRKVCTIHGTSQLETTEGVELELCLVQLEWHPDGPNLGNIIQKTMSRLATLDSETFQEKLMEMKFDETKIAQASECRLRFVSYTTFPVRDDFPRLTTKKIASITGDGDRVQRLQYQLLLSGLPEHEDSIRQIMKDSL
jgi:hypothetical protein